VDNGFQYYRTIEPLYNSRSTCITGRKSRVWKVVQVVGPDNLSKVGHGREVVLKDCWVDEGSLSEKEIQTQIFERLARVKGADYAWAPPELRDKLKGALASPKRYFMEVKLDWKEVGVNKEKPKYERAPNLLFNSDERRMANIDKQIPGTQNSSTTMCPSYEPSSTLGAQGNADESGVRKRDYKVKRHYRVIYAHVGRSLAHVTELSDAVRAFEDIFIGECSNLTMTETCLTHD
jgi:hypothetical protein